jgi:hypothetical protein
MSDTTKEIEILLKAKAQTDAAFKQVVDQLKNLGEQGKNTQKSLSEIVNSQTQKDMEGLAGSTGRLGAVLGELGPVGIAAGAAIAVVSGAAIAVGSALVSAAEDAVAWGGHLSDLSAKTDVSVEGLQRLKYEGSLVGVSLEGANQAVFKLQAAMENTPDKFEALGISMEDLRRQDPEQQLLTVAAAIRQIPDPAARSAAAIGLMGKSAKDVMPLLRSDMESAGERAQNLGMVISTDLVNSLDATGDAADTLHQTWDGLWRNIGAAIVTSGDSAGVINDIADAVGFLSRAVQEHGPEITGILQSWGLAIPSSEDLSRLEAMADIFSGRGVEINRGAAPKAFEPSTGPKKANSDDETALDAAVKKHIEDLKIAEEQAKKWGESEVRSVKEIGDHYGKLRAEYDAAQEERDKYLGAFGDSTEESQRKLDALIIQFQDIGEAQQGAFTVEQLEAFRRKLGETATALEDVHDGLGPYTAGTFDAAAESGEKLHQKLKDMGLTIENADGTWQRVDRDVVSVKGKVDDCKDSTDSLQQAFLAVDTVVGHVHEVVGVLGDAVKTFGLDATGELANVLGSFDGLASSAGNLFKTLTNPMSSPFDKVIAGAQAAIGFVGFLGSLIGGIHHAINLNDPAQRQGLQNFINDPNASHGQDYDYFNQGPNQGAQDYKNQYGNPNIPSHADGIRFVPMTGPALIHQGEAVVPAPLASFFRGPSPTSSTGGGGLDEDRLATKIVQGFAAVLERTPIRAVATMDPLEVERRVKDAMKHNRL